MVEGTRRSMQHLSETPAYVSLEFNTFVGIDFFLLNDILGFSACLHALALVALKKLLFL